MNKKTKEQNRTTGMETWNRPTDGTGKGDNGGKKVKGLVKEHV